MAKSKWVDGKYLKSNGVMARNEMVGNKYVGADGKVTTKPGTSTSKPGTTTPSKPGTTTPSKPGTTTPSNPETTPSNPTQPEGSTTTASSLVYTVKTGEFGYGAYVTGYKGSDDTVAVPATLGGAAVVSVQLNGVGVSTIEVTTYPNTSSTKQEMMQMAGLTKLDVSRCTSLRGLDCSFNNLTALVLPTSAPLERFDCSSNRLTSLDLSKYTSLRSVDCDNNRLTSVAGKLPSLTHLVVTKNNLTTINLSNYPALQVLFCGQNQISRISGSAPNLNDLDCSYNALTVLPMEGMTNLHTLTCNDNKLTSLDLSKAVGLNTLVCSNNAIKSLDLSGAVGLVTFTCQYDATKANGQAKFAALTGKAPKLVELNVANQGLTTLDMANYPALTRLYAANNQLTSITGQAPQLTYLDCGTNALKALNLANFPKISVLVCGYNYGIQLDTANSATLTELYCDNCNLQNIAPTTLPALRVLVAGGNAFSPALTSTLEEWGAKEGYTLSLDSNTEA